MQKKKKLLKTTKKNQTQVWKIPGYKTFKEKKKTKHKQTTPTRTKRNYLLFHFLFNMSHVYLAHGYFPRDI